MKKRKFSARYAPRSVFVIQCRDHQGLICFGCDLGKEPRSHEFIPQAFDESFNPITEDVSNRDRLNEARRAAIELLQRTGSVEVEGDLQSPYPSKLAWWKLPLIWVVELFIPKEFR